MTNRTLFFTVPWYWWTGTSLRSIFLMEADAQSVRYPCVRPPREPSPFVFRAFVFRAFVRAFVFGGNPHHDGFLP